MIINIEIILVSIEDKSHKKSLFRISNKNSIIGRRIACRIFTVCSFVNLPESIPNGLCFPNAMVLEVKKKTYKTFRSSN